MTTQAVPVTRVPPGHYGFRQAARMEWIKLRTPALGSIIRHGAAAIAVLVVLVFVGPLTGLAQTPAGNFLPELIEGNSLSATQPVSGFTLSPWAGLGIICAYAAVLLVVGGWRLARRDA